MYLLEEDLKFPKDSFKSMKYQPSLRKQQRLVSSKKPPEKQEIITE